MNKFSKKRDLESNFGYKEFSGYIISDGTTSTRTQIQTPGARGNLAGAPLASWVGWVDVPTNNPSSDIQIFSVATAISANPWSDSSIYANISQSGTFSITQVNSTLSNNRSFTCPASAFRTPYSGQKVWLEIRLTNGSTNPVIRVNGTDISSSFTLSTAGTIPNWLDSTTPSNFHLTGTNWPTGTPPMGCWLNYHLTDSESETWRTTGRPPLSVSVGGSQNLLTSENTSFEGGTVGNWVGAGNHARSVVSDTGASGNNVLEIVSSGVGSWTANAVYVVWTGARTTGQTY